MAKTRRGQPPAGEGQPEERQKQPAAAKGEVKTFTLRIDDRRLYDALERHAERERRSINEQILYFLERALRAVGELPQNGQASSSPPQSGQA